MASNSLPSLQGELLGSGCGINLKLVSHSYRLIAAEVRRRSRLAESTSIGDTSVPSLFVHCPLITSSDVLS